MKKAFVIFLMLFSLLSTPLLQINMANAACNERLLTFPTWYRGLATGSDCAIAAPSNISTFIMTIALNVIEVLLQLVGYIAVAYIIYGGFKYITSEGTQDGMAKAKSTITNAVIGLIISILSVGIVNAAAGMIPRG